MKKICLLRSINMAGHNMIRMTELQDMFVVLGYKDAVTFIQSGNVVFSDPEDLSDEDLSEKIEASITERFNLNISAVMRNVRELENLISQNPYLEEENFNPSRMGVVFLKGAPSETSLMKIQQYNFPPDKYQVNGKHIFLYCPDGFGRSRLSTNFFENKMKVTGTARNWQTIMTLLNMAKS